jgi:GWxTD domain-containing protein
MIRAIRGRAIVPVLLFALFAAVLLLGAGAGDDEDWSVSPEAYFLTAAEKAEWRSLGSRASRHDFQERYWLKRDPSPGSEKNEFKELVLSRIKTADQRFKIQKTPGSRTARGLVFIVLGTPARTFDDAAPHPPAASTGRRLGEGMTPVALVEGNETTSHWFYETDRTPRILEAIGRPSLEIVIVIEPSLRHDAIQNPGLFHDIQEVVARKSIVNPDLVPAAPAGDVFAAEGPSAPKQTISAAMRAILEKASPSARGEGWFANAVALFHDSGAAEAVVWLYAKPPAHGSTFSGLVRSEDGREIASWTEPPAASPLFSTAGDGAVFARRLPLPAGAYTVAMTIADPAGVPLVSSSVPLRVPALERTEKVEKEKPFAVSSMILTAGPAPAPGGAAAEKTFAFGGATLPPRADAVFKTAQSLWYFVLVANPSDTGKVFLEPRLRRNGEPAGGLPPFAPRLAPIGGGRYLTGVEIPLATLPPGDYVLYLTIRDGGTSAAAELRRAEFRLVP